MSSSGVATIDECDVHVGVIDQSVGEGHAHGTSAHDQVVGGERALVHDDRRYLAHRPELALPGQNGTRTDPQLDEPPSTPVSVTQVECRRITLLSRRRQLNVFPRHIEIAKPWWTAADLCELRCELRRLGTARVLHRGLVGRKLDH